MGFVQASFQLLIYIFSCRLQYDNERASASQVSPKDIKLRPQTAKFQDYGACHPLKTTFTTQQGLGQFSSTACAPNMRRLVAVGT